MRKILYALLLMATTLNCKSQDDTTVNSEFHKNKNGLIYSESDVAALRFVVDSLNLKFKTCDLNKKYNAYPQAHAYSINFSSNTNDLSEIVSALKSSADFNTLINKYDSLISKSDSNLLVVELPEKEEGKWQYLSGNAFEGFESQWLLSGSQKCATKKWIVDYEKKGAYHDYYSISSIFIAEDFMQPVIPDKYAKLIQYIDCMIDTSATIYLTDKFTDRFSGVTRDNALYVELNNFLNTRMKIKKDKSDYTYDYLSNEKIRFAIDSLRNNPFVVKKVHELADWYLKKGGGSDDVEELIAAFISKEKALEIKRHRRVMGMCSMDESPRVHARNIAMLAAETHSWDIFLRAHLDIMNDRFERATDGSYAWGKRQTYIKELEVLDINVTDMMLGLSLRAYNVARDHYNGTVWRIGKALGESKDRLQFEGEIKNIMKDNSLDPFNRSLMFLLYHTYLNYLPDKDERKSKVEEFKKTISQYPAFIQAGINEMKPILAD